MTSYLLRWRVDLAAEPLVAGEIPVAGGTRCQGSRLVAGEGNTGKFVAPRGDTLWRIVARSL